VRSGRRFTREPQLDNTPQMAAPPPDQTSLF
jgi:hypothetical protein